MAHEKEPDPLDALLGLGSDDNDANGDDERPTLDDLRLQLASPVSEILGQRVRMVWSA